MMNFAYAEGKARAEEEFGLRIASDSYSRGLPHGDMALPVERLAKHLTNMDPGVSRKKEERRSRFGNPVRWGAVSSPHGINASSFDYSGIGRDGAAI